MPTATSPELHLDEATHTYTLGGRVLPGVTGVLENALREMEGIPEHVYKAAGEFGQHVDSACHLFDHRNLDWESLDPRLMPYVRGYEKFIYDSSVTIIASKKRVHHPARGYAGEMDKLILMRGLARPCVLDVKSSSIVPKSVGPQTAAYREAYVAMGNEADQRRYSLHLRPDGTYRLDRLNDQADYSVFLSALNIWRFKYG